MPLPGWLAVTVQMPTATNVMVVPLTVHAAGDCEVRVTGNPELALTGGANGGVPSVWLDIAGKVIVWLSSAGEIRNVWVTGGAGAYVTPSPAWFAVIAQLPAAINVMVVPLAEQIAGEVELSVTGSPELALTGGMNGAAPRVCVGIAGKVIVWLSSAGESREVWVSGGAGAYVTPSPGWFAVIVQLPAAINVMVVPLAEQIVGEPELSVTGSPELALTGGMNGAAPRVCAGIAGKVIVWLSSAGEIRKVCVTGGAGAYVTPSPGWFAVIVQLPAAVNVMVVPLAEQVAGDVELNVTASPELALTGDARGGLPKFWPAMAGNVIV